MPVTSTLKGDDALLPLPPGGSMWMLPGAVTMLVDSGVPAAAVLLYTESVSADPAGAGLAGVGWEVVAAANITMAKTTRMAVFACLGTSSTETFGLGSSLAGVPSVNTRIKLRRIIHA